MNRNEQHMHSAVTVASYGIDQKSGGPFGAVIVKDNNIIASGYNKVLESHDPTAHGEIVAIRNACRKLKTHDLSGCTLYTTGYPCPMCFGAALWAKIDKIYYGCNLKDTEEIGFNDSYYYHLLDIRNSNPYLEQVGHDECKDLYEQYMNIDHELY